MSDARLDPRRGAAGGVGPSDQPLVPPLSHLGRLRLVAEVLATYAEVRWRLWRCDLKQVVAALRERTPTSELPTPGLESHWQAVRLAKATTSVLALLPTDSRCLMRSLVLIGLLARRGIGGVLVVGVDAEPEFQAHAWVEHRRRPLLPKGEFGRLAEL